MGKACAIHPDRPSVTMCHQCHRPVCKSCTTVTPHGSFCSATCSVQNREFKQNYREGSGGTTGGVAAKLFLAVLLLVLLAVGIHLVAKRGFAPARSVDLLGRLLEKVEAAKTP